MKFHKNYTAFCEIRNEYNIQYFFSAVLSEGAHQKSYIKIERRDSYAKEKNIEIAFSIEDAEKLLTFLQEVVCKEKELNCSEEI